MNLFRSLFLVFSILFLCSSCEAQEVEELADKSILKKKQTLEGLEKNVLRITMTNSAGEEYAEDVDLGWNLISYKSGKSEKIISSEITQGIEGQTVIRTVYRLESGEEYAEDIDLSFNLLSY